MAIILRKVLNYTVKTVLVIFTLFGPSFVLPLIGIYIRKSFGEPVSDLQEAAFCVFLVIGSYGIMFIGGYLVFDRLNVCPQCGHFSKCTGIISGEKKWNYILEEEEEGPSTSTYGCIHCGNTWES